MTDPATHRWDVVVIGAGLGGGLAARVLAEAGLRVLVLEKGRGAPRRDEARINAAATDPEARAVRGLWPLPVNARVNGRSSSFFAPIGAGIGGSSVFYAATLERPERHDLDHSEAIPHPTGGWPVSYEVILPWFARAEDLLSVNTKADICDADARLEASFKRKGLSPYRLAQSIRRVEGCQDCLGHRCPRMCKMDGRSAGIEPAIATGRAEVWTEAEVTALRGAGNKVTGVDVVVNGAPGHIAARAFVLAAGALCSPQILLHSGDWQNGAANRSDWVGRGLMFHLNEMFAIWPGGQPGGSPGQTDKSLGLRDFYLLDNQRMGAVQSMGIGAEYPEILHYLRERMARRRLGASRLAQELARIPAGLAARYFGEARIFVGLLEDLPRPENRVCKSPAVGTITFDYAVTDELRKRRRQFRRAIRHRLRGLRPTFLGHMPEPNFGHPCGTLRMGSDPTASVLDGWGRCHDLANLRVADASAFATSMGVNPSLTIAALALRMADDLAREIKEGACDAH